MKIKKDIKISITGDNKPISIECLIEWISVEDKLPEKESEILVFDEYAGFNVAHYTISYRTPNDYIFENSFQVQGCGCCISNDDFILRKVTHWMPLSNKPI